MGIKKIIGSVNGGENVLILYPDNDVFLSLSKLIADHYGRKNIGWFVFNEIAKKRLEKFFKIFSRIAPKDAGRVFMSYDDIDRKIVISYGYHFQLFTGMNADDPLIRLILDDEVTLYNFIYRNAIDERKSIALRDLFDYVIDVEEKEAPLGKEFFYSVKAYVYPHTEFSGAIRIDGEYNLVE
ncbi:hypothetical protein GAH_00045 [Geoglobus ahangari]|uniref:MEDS domain-containing protein n=1 Tax=Geoglobus ahangari TaxID=113653 RepID=A0A0F7IK12_9EURY|nr:hypothetical protein [Geoglobus ahangari]AKG92594.1 hypothetical protein GAH_00045 [Geoglobus ahangari]NOY10937.1 hypothetical protein [Archaeoglobi archaeon]